jgi:hypothetical protein
MTGLAETWKSGGTTYYSYTFNLPLSATGHDLHLPANHTASVLEATFIFPGAAATSTRSEAAESHTSGFAMWRWITGEPTKAFPQARFSFYRVARSEGFASHFGFSRVGAANRTEYAAFLRQLRSAEFRQSNFLQGGWAGHGANGNIDMALSRRNLNTHCFTRRLSSSTSTICWVTPPLGKLDKRR